MSDEKKEFQVYKYRTLEDFVTVGYVEVPGRLNPAPQLQKRPNSTEDVKAKSAKYEKIWWPKPADSFDLAFMETVAGNFRALINTNGAYPKVRWVTNEKNEPYVLTENVPGFQSLADIEKQEKGATKKKLLNREFKSAGEFTLLNFYLGEMDSGASNIAFGERGDMMTVDNGFCFGFLQSIRNPAKLNYHYTAKDIISLPFLHDCHPLHYFDFIENGEKQVGDSCFFDPGFSIDPDFLREKHRTILKILLLPKDFLEKFVDCYANEEISSAKVDGVKSALAGWGNDKLLSVVKANPAFRKYLQSAEAEADAKVFLQHLAEFTPISKNSALKIYPDLPAKVEDNFHTIRKYFTDVSLQDIEDEKQRRGIWFYIENHQSAEAAEVLLTLLDNDDPSKLMEMLEQADNESVKGRNQKRRLMLNIFSGAIEENRPNILNALLREIVANYDEDITASFIDKFKQLNKQKGVDKELVQGAFRKFVELAVSWGQTEIFMEQLSMMPLDASINQKGQTALNLAAECGHADIVQLLLHRQAEVNLRDHSGQTALAAAAQNGHADIVALLLESNANPELGDNKSRTPMDWAKQQEFADVEKLLLTKPKSIEIGQGFSDEKESYLTKSPKADTSITVEALLARKARRESLEYLDTNPKFTVPPTTASIKSDSFLKIQRGT